MKAKNIAYCIIVITIVAGMSLRGFADNKLGIKNNPEDGSVSVETNEEAQAKLAKIDFSAAFSTAYNICEYLSDNLDDAMWGTLTCDSGYNGIPTVTIGIPNTKNIPAIDKILDKYYKENNLNQFDVSGALPETLVRYVSCKYSKKKLNDISVELNKSFEGKRTESKITTRIDWNGFIYVDLPENDTLTKDKLLKNKYSDIIMVQNEKTNLS